MEIRNTRLVGADQTGSASPGGADGPAAPDSLTHQDHSIVLQQGEHGWSAYVPAFDIETMCFAGRFHAVAAAREVIDGMLRAEQAAQPRN